jgi:hypothetical protein
MELILFLALITVMLFVEIGLLGITGDKPK